MTAIEWLRNVCADYAVEPVAVFRRHGDHSWPLEAKDEDELESKLRKGEHLIPLPREPAALANIIEVSLADYLLRRLSELYGVVGTRGTERGYPDLEMSGGPFGPDFIAVDIKVAKRADNGHQTQSRITLYTGNTYFRYPNLHWPGTFRSFAEYGQHIDVFALYTLDRSSMSGIDDLKLIVQEPWRIASRQRSSTTREYLGAVLSIRDLREGNGEFRSPEEFYRYWRKFPFKTGKVVEQQLQKLLRHTDMSSHTAKSPGPRPSKRKE